MGKQEPVAINRRKFIQRVALGVGVSILGLPNVVAAAGQTEVLLLSCMDYRLIDETQRYMLRRGLRN
ncbi:MAG: hypothetical protein RLZZ156_1105, partial [Deinococcota bacterium]